MIFQIEGMACEHCVQAVSDALHALPIESAKVWIGGADVAFDPLLTSPDQIREVIEEQGYDCRYD